MAQESRRSSRPWRPHAGAATAEWDSQPVYFQDCYQDSEESFISADYLKTHAYLRSTGEKRIGLVNELIDYIETRFLTYKLRGNERPTLLLDEMDNHIGFAGQSILLKRDNLLRQDNIIVLAEHYAEICLTELERAIRYFNKTRGGDSE